VPYYHELVSARELGGEAWNYEKFVFTKPHHKSPSKLMVNWCFSYFTELLWCGFWGQL